MAETPGGKWNERQRLLQTIHEASVFADGDEAARALCAELEAQDERVRDLEEELLHKRANLDAANWAIDELQDEIRTLRNVTSGEMPF